MNQALLQMLLEERESDYTENVLGQVLSQVLLKKPAGGGIIRPVPGIPPEQIGPGMFKPTVADAGVRPSEEPTPRPEPINQRELQKQILIDTLTGGYGAQRPETKANQFLNLLMSPDAQIRKLAEQVVGPAVRQYAGAELMPAPINIYRSDSETGGIIERRVTKEKASQLVGAAQTAIGKGEPLINADWRYGTHEKRTGQVPKVPIRYRETKGGPILTDWVAIGKNNSKIKELIKKGCEVLTSPKQKYKKLNYWDRLTGEHHLEMLPVGVSHADRVKELKAQTDKAGEKKFTFEKPEEAEGRQISKPIWRSVKNKDGSISYRKQTVHGTAEEIQEQLEKHPAWVQEQPELMTYYDLKTGKALGKKQVPKHLAESEEMRLQTKGQTFIKPGKEPAGRNMIEYETPGGDIEHLPANVTPPRGYVKSTESQRRAREEKLLSAASIIEDDPSDATLQGHADYYNKYSNKNSAYLWVEEKDIYFHNLKFKKIELPKFRREQLTSSRLMKLAKTNNMKPGETLYWILVEENLPSEERKKPSPAALKKAKAQVKVWSKKQGLTQGGLLAKSPEEIYRQIFSPATPEPGESLRDTEKRRDDEIISKKERPGMKRLQEPDVADIPGAVVAIVMKEKDLQYGRAVAWVNAEIDRNMKKYGVTREQAIDRLTQYFLGRE